MIVMQVSYIYIYKQNKYYIHMVKREFSVDFKREFNYKNMFEYFFYMLIFQFM